MSVHEAFRSTHDHLRGYPLLFMGVGHLNAKMRFEQPHAQRSTSIEARKSTRHSRSEEPPPAPPLPTTELDANGAVVYVDLQSEAEHDNVHLVALSSALLALQPTKETLERLPLINRSRVLVEITDAVALDHFLKWLLSIAATRFVLRELLRPLGPRVLLLGAHFICPRVTEMEPTVAQQLPHTDVERKGQVIAIGLNLSQQPMDTLLDATATLDAHGRLVGGKGFGRADTPLFAYDTGAVHAGPGKSNIEGPFPKFLTDRVFFLLCSADAEPATIAAYRADNGLAGAGDLTVVLPAV